MRLWSIHPRYLDTKGLVALWRETLLAKHVLEGKTKGYKNHPQLNRFKIQDGLNNINYYLSVILEEAKRRNYKFDESKINWSFVRKPISVTRGQVEYETKHLLGKLKTRDENLYKQFQDVTVLETHPLFEVVNGEVESWEIITK
jgi:hypothetical protein